VQSIEENEEEEKEDEENGNQDTREHDISRERIKQPKGFFTVKKISDEKIFF
jgi:hypothetical protein